MKKNSKLEISAFHKKNRSRAGRTGIDPGADLDLMHLAALSICTGAATAIYILVLSHLQLNDPAREPLKHALVLAETEIKQIHLLHGGLGRIGLLDARLSKISNDSSIEPGNFNQTAYQGSSRAFSNIRSLNTARATLRCAAIISAKLDDAHFLSALDEDISSLEQLEKDLLETVAESIKPVDSENPVKSKNENSAYLDIEKEADQFLSLKSKERENQSEIGSTSSYSANRSNSTRSEVYLRVRTFLERNIPPNSEFKSLKLTLGRYKGDARLLSTPISQTTESSESFVKDGCYVADIPIQTTKRNYLRFYEVAKGSQSVDPADFVSTAPGVVPTALLLEATYKTTERNGDQKLIKEIKKIACRTLSHDKLEPESSCFVLRFPHGLPEQITSFEQLLSKDLWKERGEWEQASGGPVPGKGSLGPTIEPVLLPMSPGEALSICLYHWLRHLYPIPNTEAVLQLLQSRLHSGEAANENKILRININSALLQDTGARERAYIKGTGPRSQGQKALESCFSYHPEESDFPPESLPLLVDGRGELKLPARNVFDETLLKQYLEAIYETNQAALESMAVARSLESGTKAELERIAAGLLIKRQEVASLQVRLIKLERENKMQEELDKARRLLKDKEEELRRLKRKSSTLAARVKLSRQVAANAQRTAMTTVEITSSNFSALKGGLHRLDLPNDGFLIGRKTVFMPLRDPVSHQDIIEAAYRNKDDYSWLSPTARRWLQNSSPAIQDWKVAEVEHGRLTIGENPISAIVAEVESIKPWFPVTLILDSSDLLSPDTVTIHKDWGNPFAGLPISDGQAFFYCQNAFESGQNYKVGWSAAIRDLVYHRARGSHGMPLESLDWSWGAKSKPPLQGNPAMAVEFQLRRPLPRLFKVLSDKPDQIFSGAYITDPIYKRKIRQIPPVPASMM